MNAIENIITRYRLHKTQCDKRRKEIDREIEQLKQERERLNNPHWTKGLLQPVMKEVARLTPKVDWENNDEFYPMGLRGAVTVFGRTKRGVVVCITFTESRHDLWFDTDRTHTRFTPGTMGEINGLNNITAPVGDGEALLEYIRKHTTNTKTE